MAVNAKTVILKTMVFVIKLAEESQNLKKFIIDIKKYKEKMEKQEYLSILEQLDNL